MSVPYRPRRLAVAGSLAASAIALGALSSPAAAAPQWLHDTAVEDQTPGALVCAGGTPGNLLDEMTPIMKWGEVFLDPARPAPARGIQYARVTFFHTTSFDDCHEQGGSRAQVEVIPPPGTRLAIGPRSPLLCTFAFFQPPTPCRTILRPGEFGGTVLADGRSGRPDGWQLSSRTSPTALIVPIRLQRRIASFAQRAEFRCEPFGPCPAGRSADRVQFSVRFIPGRGGTPSRPLLTTVGLLGGAGRAAPPVIARRPPKVVTRARLRRGVTLRVRAPKGARVRALLKVGRRTVAIGARRGSVAGVVTLRVKGRPAALRRLRARTSRARLIVTVRKGSSRRGQALAMRIRR